MIQIIGYLPKYIFSHKFDYFYFVDSNLLVEENFPNFWELLLFFMKDTGSTRGVISWLSSVEKRKFQQAHQRERKYTSFTSNTSFSNIADLPRSNLEDPWLYSSPLIFDDHATWAIYQENIEFMIWGLKYSCLPAFRANILQENMIRAFMIESIEELCDDYNVRFGSVSEQIADNYPFGPLN